MKCWLVKPKGFHTCSFCKNHVNDCDFADSDLGNFFVPRFSSDFGHAGALT